MLKTFLPILVCSLLVSGCTALPQEARENPTKITSIVEKKSIPADFIPRDIKVVMIGDSLTEGVGDQTKKGGYLSFLKELLEDEKGINKAELQNFGVSGHRTTQLLNRLKRTEVNSAIEEADLVIITIGGNDMMKVVRENLTNLDFNDFENDKRNYEKNLNDVLTKIRTENHKGSIVLIGLYNPFSIALSEIKEIDQVVSDWNETSQKITSKYYQAYFVEIADIFQKNNIDAILHTDFFHPNNAGYKLIGERVYSLLNKRVLDNFSNLVLSVNKEEIQP